MSTTASRPWHLWIVGILALLWNSMGLMDFVMTQTGNEQYLSNFSDAERAFFTGIPLWAVIFWALSVGSATLASLLLLMRKKLAAPLYAIALVSFLVVCLQNYIIASPTMNEVVGTFSLIFSVIIFAITLGCWLYARKMRENGVLG